MHATENAKLVGAIRTLSTIIDAPDDIPAMALREAADRIEELAAIALELLAHTSCEQTLPAGCPRCELSGRLAALGITSE